jgi:fucose 4-O-acetylase-like acetyltransferase
MDGLSYMVDVSEVLEPIAAWFRSLGVPHVIVHWGHPLMMAIAVFVLGSFVGVAGWRGKLLEDQDKDAAVKSRVAHRQLAPWLFLFLAGGYIGGVLALEMHHQPIFESPHFWTGSLVLLLLLINGVISLSGFAGNKKVLRAVHSYLGSTALGILFIHALLGLKLGLSF